MPEVKTKGLAGVIAGETAISSVGKEGIGLSYRGYSIYDLARTPPSRKWPISWSMANFQT